MKNDLFKNPPTSLRSKAFWSWNGELNESSIRSQVQAMRDMGMGGFYMHARVGLKTAFLSDAWFAIVDAAVDEARKCGIEAWIYDEDRYPSGAAGGLATQDERFRARYLVCDNSPVGECLARFAVVRDGNAVQRYVRLHTEQESQAAEEVVSFRLVVEPPSDWYNGQSYLNTLDRSATDEFLRVGYQPYINRCGGAIGNVIGGVFTDEPSYGNLFNDENPPQLRWTDKLPEIFQEKYGYDLLDRLPELFFDVKEADCPATRYDYVRLITELFVENFMRPIAQFCDRHGMRLTGHVRQEDTLAHQTSLHGSCMMALEPMQLPGIDYLTETRRTYATCKYAASVARQLGREGALSEMYGCTGWDFTLAEQKAMGDMQFALGITRRCLHHFFYTLAGEAKRDFPASISPFSPWWSDYHRLEDYFARLAALAEGAEARRPIAVLNTVESMWTCIRLGWFDAPENRYLDGDKVALEDALLNAQLDFDFIDEGLLQRHGRIDSVDGKAALHMGRCAYSVVIVPSCITIRDSTAALLNAFAANGGKIIFAGELPDRINGRLQAYPADLAKQMRGVDAATAVNACLADGLAPIELKSDSGAPIAGVLSAIWEAPDETRIFICNTGYSASQLKEAYFAYGARVRDRRQGYDRVTISHAGGDGVPELWDPWTGVRYHAAARRVGDRWEIDVALRPQQTWVVVYPRERRVGELPAYPQATDGARSVVLADEFAVTLTEPNVVVLDTLMVQLPCEAARRQMDVRAADDLVRQRMGWQPHHARMRQPWCDPERNGDIKVMVEYTIDVECQPTGRVALAGEQMDRMKAWLDDRPIDMTADGHWIDDSLSTVPLPASWLTPGTHTLRVQIAYAYHSTLEAMYLLGDFGVSVTGTITAPVRQLSFGDWTAQGLKFYSGSVRCRWEIDLPLANEDARVLLKLDEQYAGGLLNVWFNGEWQGQMIGPPLEVALPAVGGGVLEIELAGTRRNSHGPLHLCNWSFYSGSPWEFNPDPYHYTPNWVTVPFGIPSAPLIVWHEA